MWTYLKTPNPPSKTHYFPNPTNAYSEFMNAFSYRALLKNPGLTKQNLKDRGNKEWKVIKLKSQVEQQLIIKEYFSYERPLTKILPLGVERTSTQTTPPVEETQTTTVTTVTTKAPPKNATKQLQIIDKMTALSTSNSALMIAEQQLSSNPALKISILNKIINN